MKLLSRIFCGYLKLLEKTVRLEIRSRELFTGNQVVGFWHEDSFTMNLLLKKFTAENQRISVLITGDPRGQYIGEVVEQSGGKAVRLDYSKSPVDVMKRLLCCLKQQESVAVAMDGPLGPRREPKKLVYLLQKHSRTKLIGVEIVYSHKIALKKRWDHYRIPLPFTQITIIFTAGVAESSKV